MSQCRPDCLTAPLGHVQQSQNVAQSCRNIYSSCFDWPAFPLSLSPFLCLFKGSYLSAAKHLVCVGYIVYVYCIYTACSL